MELLVTVGIMVLVASIAVAAIAPMVRGRALDSGAHAVEAMIYQARTHAVTARTDATIRFRKRDGRMELFSTLSDAEDGAPAGRVEEPDYLPVGVQFLEFWNLVEVGPPAPPGELYLLVFDPSGSLDPTTPGLRRIYLSDPNGRNVKVVEVLFASGQTRIYDE